ncbi:MAG: hypothetical protein ACR2L4_02750 [Actinomycetota bacterium]
MGAFNTVHAKVECSNCHHTVEKAIQFKYGDCWQHDYAIGDKLAWGGNDKGEPGVPRVRVRAIAEACPDCGFKFGEWYDVIIERDVITAVQRQPDGHPDYFYVVEDE